MSARNVVLTEHLDRFIDEGVDSGRFRDASDAVQEALVLLEQRENNEDEKLTWLRDVAQKAFAALDRGEGIPLNSKEDVRNMIRAARLPQ